MAKLVELAPANEKNMKRLVMIILMGLFCMSNVSYAGNGDLTVGGALEMTSSGNGFLPPRMTTSNRGNISPSPGMLIYNTDDNAYNYYTSSGWNILAASPPVHDNTGASSDYALAVGETAKITFTSTTSVPLHISTSQGEYEITILGASNIGTSDSFTSLQANNANQSSGSFVSDSYGEQSNQAFWGASGTDVVAYIGVGGIIRATVRVSTFTTCKAMCSTVHGKRTNRQVSTTNTYWNDTTTSWTSLGTIKFSISQSGTIIIRRIL